MGPGVPMLLGCCLLTAWTWNGHAIADDANPRVALPTVPAEFEVK